jgi:hypothetical protein
VGGDLAAAEDQAETIAFYSVRKILPILLLLLVLAGILVWVWCSALIDPRDFFNFRSFRPYFLIAGSILYLLCLPAIIRVFRQVLFKHMLAVWIEDRRLIYLDCSFFSVPCADIAGVSLERYGPYSQEGISILKKDGQKKVLPVGALSDDSDVILDRLRKVCLT